MHDGASYGQEWTQRRVAVLVVVVRLAGGPWFVGGKVERRRSVGRVLACSLRAVIGVGEGGEWVSEVRWLQIEQELGWRGAVP